MTDILDYGMGNLASVTKAISHLGFESRIIPADSRALAESEKLVIPGVGAFGAAMERLSPIADSIRQRAHDGIPILGICLGQQLLFDSSEEHGDHAGLGLIPGQVRYLPCDMGVKIPHIGWSRISRLDTEMFRGVPEEVQVYFVHSLVADCAPQYWAATAEHGVEFPAAVRRDRVWGMQFHPEKSSSFGLMMLRNFLTC